MNTAPIQADPRLQKQHWVDERQAKIQDADSRRKAAMAEFEEMQKKQREAAANQQSK